MAWIDGMDWLIGICYACMYAWMDGLMDVLVCGCGLMDGLMDGLI